MIAVEAAVFGLVFGSFANVAMERLPRGASLTDRSRCNGCARTLRAFELIPLVSFAMLRGQCRSCGEAIGIRTPAVEAGTAIAFGAAFLALPASVAVAVCSAFVALTIATGALMQRRVVDR